MSPQLLATCWTTAGDAAPYPGQELSPFSMEERIEAASAAGFTGFGILDVDLRKFLAKNTVGRLKSLLTDHGFEVIELEFLTNWWTRDDRRVESDELRFFLLDTAQALGARHIKAAPDLNGGSFDLSLWSDEFAQLCSEAETHNTRIALEFLPMSNVPNLASALDLFSAAGEPKGGGLMVDLWHVQRSGTSLDDLARAPLSSIVAVELDDADNQVVGTLYDDTVLRRKLLGMGDFPVESFLQTMVALGWKGPWGVEILSEDFRRRPLGDAVSDAYSTTIAAFQRAGLT